MRALLTLIGSLLVVGCWSNKLVKEQSLTEKIVGTYERKEGNATFKSVFLANGVCEEYLDGAKKVEFEWKIIGEEVVLYGLLADVFCNIETNGDLTAIAMEANGERHQIPKGLQLTLKKIK